MNSATSFCRQETFYQFFNGDIQVLLKSSGKLTPLRYPAQNAPKWFAVVEMIWLC